MVLWGTLDVPLARLHGLHIGPDAVCVRREPARRLARPSPNPGCPSETIPQIDEPPSPAGPSRTRGVVPAAGDASLRPRQQRFLHRLAIRGEVYAPRPPVLRRDRHDFDCAPLSVPAPQRPFSRCSGARSGRS